MIDCGQQNALTPAALDGVDVMVSPNVALEHSPAVIMVGLNTRFDVLRV